MVGMVEGVVVVVEGEGGMEDWREVFIVADEGLKAMELCWLRCVGERKAVVERAPLMMMAAAMADVNMSFILLLFQLYFNFIYRVVD